MTSIFELDAESRSDMGKGASRRLRRDGKVPAVMYGGNEAPVVLTLTQSELFKRLQHEAFYSQILTVNVDGKSTKAVLRDIQRHPSRPILLHIDFQRVEANMPVRVRVPVHLVGAEVAPGVKTAGGLMMHEVAEVELEVLPEHLPAFIQLDVSAMEIGDALRMSDLILPETGSLVELARGEDHDQPIAVCIAPRGGGDEDEDEDEAAGEGQGEGDEAAEGES